MYIHIRLHMSTHIYVFALKQIGFYMYIHIQINIHARICVQLITVYDYIDKHIRICLY
jgi:hypothetical protein